MWCYKWRESDKKRSNKTETGQNTITYGPKWQGNVVLKKHGFREKEEFKSPNSRKKKITTKGTNRTITTSVVSARNDILGQLKWCCSGVTIPLNKITTCKSERCAEGGSACIMDVIHISPSTQWCHCHLCRRRCTTLLGNPHCFHYQP